MKVGDHLSTRYYNTFMSSSLPFPATTINKLVFSLELPEYLLLGNPIKEKIQQDIYKLLLLS